ncbi:MAG: hypothetical protein Q4P05_08030 [Actinomycetaceae bacterium]|nr:hypothetical protein [Actinomycetaceae bacterium]
MTILAPICYFAMPVFYLIAIMDNSPRYFETIGTALIIAIPILALISFLAIVLNRAPAVYSIAQGTMVILGALAVVGWLGYPPFDDYSQTALMGKLLFAVAMISPVIGSVAGTRMALRSTGIAAHLPLGTTEPPTPSSP